MDSDGNEECNINPITILIVSHIFTLYQTFAMVAEAATLLLDEFDDNSVGGFSVNPIYSKIRRLNGLMQRHISLFKMITGFYPAEFEALCQRLCPTLALRARHTNKIRNSAAGRPTKLTIEERLLSYIMYLRGNNGIRQESATWNYSRTSLHDDVLFICGVLNDVMEDEIKSPSATERAHSRNRITFFPGCVGFVDGTLCRIKRPKTEHHRAYFNGRKKMYCLNPAVVIDHDGLFVFIAPGYAGSYHDVTVFRDMELSRNWQQFFAVDLDSSHPVEYLLADPGYLGLDHFILRRIDAREVANVDDDPVLRAFNKLHAGYRVQVEWGIGGLKQLFRRFLDICPNRRDKFTHLFTTAAILTNFLHRRRRDFSINLSNDASESVGEWAN